MWWILVAACSQPPALSEVSPATVEGTATLELRGTHFGKSAQVVLRDGTTEHALDVVKSDAVHVELSLPKALPAATYDVVLTTAGTTIALDDALTVTAPVDDVPCDHNYQTNTEISLTRKEVVVDRFYVDGKRDLQTLPLERVRSIRHRVVHSEPVCHAVYLVLDDDTQVLFEDDNAVDLAARAERVAEFIGLPFDGVADGTP